MTDPAELYEDTRPTVDLGVGQALEVLRRRLLDLTKRNPLLNFRHSERSRTQVRVIDELPNQLWTRLLENRRMTFVGLPPPPDELADEKTDTFLMALDVARNEDREFVSRIQALGDEPDIDEVEKLERALRDRIRHSLGLPPRPSKHSMKRSDYAAANGLNPSYDLPLPPTGADTSPQRHSDDLIQLLLHEDEAEAKLSALRSASNTSLEERGINTLFSAFGFLEWCEAEHSEKKLLSPLLLLPLTLDRELVGGGYRYFVNASDEEVVVNPVLKEKLRRDFHNELPDYTEDGLPEDYFAAVTTTVCQVRRDWRVRRMITIGQFYFQKLIMYEDLNPARWPKDCAIDENPIVTQLLTGPENVELSPAEEYEIDQPSVDEALPPLIFSADGSQTSALLDALGGRCLAIEGPPGTGKSQTIANMIGAFLAKGKSVLFVAEKMAALNVVKSRLDAAGLGDFVFEVHSTKAKKTEIVQSLEARLTLESARPKLTVEDVRPRRRAARDWLNGYARFLGTKQKIGLTAHELLWRARSRFEEAKRFWPHDQSLPRLTSPLSDSSEVLASARELEHLAKGAKAQYGKLRHHPLFGTNAASVTDFGVVERQLKALSERLAVFRQNCVVEDGAAFEDVKRCASFRLPEPLPAPLASGLSAIPPAHLHELRPRLEQLEVARKSLETAYGLRFLSGYQETRYLRGAADFAQKLGVKTLAEARNSKVSLSHAIGEVGEFRSFLTLAREILPESASTIGNAKSLAVVVNVLGRLSDEARAVGIATYVEVANRTLLEHARAEIAAIQQLEQPLQSILDTELLRRQQLEQLEEALVEYRSYRWWSFLRGPFRRASKLTKLLFNEPLPPSELVSHLQQAIRSVSRLRAFEGDTRLQSLLGARFRGTDSQLEPDFELIRAIEALETLRSQAPASRTVVIDRVVRLPQRELDRLDHWQEFLSDSSLLRLLRAEPREEALIDDWLKELEGRAESCRRLVQYLERLSVPADLELEKLRTSAQLLDEKVVPVTIHLRAMLPAAAESIEPAMVSGALFASFMFCVSARRLGLSDHSIASVLNGKPDAVASGTITHARHLISTTRDLVNRVGAEPLPLRALDLKRLHSVLRVAAGREGVALEWAQMAAARTRLERAGLSEVLRVLQESDYEGLAILAEAVYLNSQTAPLEEMIIRGALSGERVEQTRKEFAASDSGLLEAARVDLKNLLLQRKIPKGRSAGKVANKTELGLLQHEIKKSKRHLPLRTLISRSPRALRALKPCFMMSPISVAQVLDPTQDKFDVVIVDEASQMRPEDAIGAMARARQAIVVGDPKQLPPTSFFTIGGDEEEDDDEHDTGTLESVLDQAMRCWTPHRRLLWHYRSRHESLIQFSNHWFYDNSLVVLPSPKTGREGFGVVLERVEDGLYAGKTNQVEAMRVAQAALKLMEREPDRSLGVVAMNQAQSDIIRSEIDRLIEKSDRAARYVEHWESVNEGLEKFFVKNLENVQGDERDVIYISGTYGRTSPSVPPKMTMFGPINKAGGHRRLNVLFTRAKEHVRFFCSLRANDIVASEGGAIGRNAFRGYLEFADRGMLESGRYTGREPDSDFEIFVKTGLERLGYEVVCQVGVGRYSVDLGVKHAAFPDGFLAGIECDGATYHSSKSARDRDILRQRVLEDLGWSIYRIWSTDWFTNPQRELEKADAYLKRLLERH